MEKQPFFRENLRLKCSLCTFPYAALKSFILLPFLNGAVFGVTFASVAGIMVYISLDELLPTAEKYGEHHIAIYGLISGMVVMAASLVMLL